jgi:hypothetical protein
MLTGFNTDVNHEGKTFHVQTEDKGESNPVIETLIYEGGQILASRRQDYAERNGEGASRDLLVALMERQHQAVVRDIRLGKYDPPESRRPFGEGIISDRSLEELVKEFIETAAAEGNLPASPVAERAARSKGRSPALAGSRPEPGASHESQAPPARRTGKSGKAPASGNGAAAGMAPGRDRAEGHAAAPAADKEGAPGRARRGGKDTRSGKPYRIKK